MTKSEPELGALKLSQGKYAIVDNENFEMLNKYKWTFHALGYAYRMEHTSRAGGQKRKSTCFLLHREIMQPKKGEYIDHINGNKLDNRRSNLRICTHSQNLMNRPKQSNNTSGYKGVWWHNTMKKWGSSIWVNRKQIHLGYFKSKKTASKKYEEAALKIYGSFAYRSKLNET